MLTAGRPKVPVARLAYAARVSKAFATQPNEALERTLEKFAAWRDDRTAGFRYPVLEGADHRVHQLIGARWPCEEVSAFDQVWTDALNELQARELQVGRGAFGGWDDGDARLVRFAWCCVRHLRPHRVLETGVARGLTTRAVLEAMTLNGEGHLWSIDLPPLLETGFAAETAVAVPKRLYGRWMLFSGSCRRMLPGLVAELGTIDLFIHDSMHTTRNVMFELEHVWPALAPGGAMLIDDIDKNAAIGQFAKAHPSALSMIFPSDDGKGLIGCLVKP